MEVTKGKVRKPPRRAPMVASSSLLNPLGLETIRYSPGLVGFTGYEIENRKPVSKARNIPVAELPEYSKREISAVRASDAIVRAALANADPNGIVAKEFAAKLEREAARKAAQAEQEALPAMQRREGIATKQTGKRTYIRDFERVWGGWYDLLNRIRNSARQLPTR